MIHTSIIIPCRPFWPTEISECLESIKNKTHDLSGIEIIIKIDHHDPGTLEAVNKWKETLPIKTIIMDGLYGRGGLVEYSNVLAWNSVGKFIWWWSDEARMITHHWDIIIQEYINKYENTAMVLFPSGCCYQPCMTRKWLEQTGRFAYHSCIDSYLGLTAGPLNKIVNMTKILVQERPSDPPGWHGERSLPSNSIDMDILLNELRKLYPNELDIWFMESSCWIELNDPKIKDIFNTIVNEMRKR